jgi:hypothetical protein
MQAAAFIYTNFPPGFHNVVVTVTNSGGGWSTLDYIASADQAVPQAPVILAGNVLYPTNWSSGGSPARINAFNAAIYNDCQTLRYVGFPVALVDISTICMPFTNTGYMNNLHPGVAANVAEAQAFINAANATENASQLSGSISNIPLANIPSAAVTNLAVANIPIFTNSGISIVTNSGLQGAGSSASIAGSDTSHLITLVDTTGVNGTLCTVTFSAPRSTTNYCVEITPLGINTINILNTAKMGVGTITTNGYTLYVEPNEINGTMQFMDTVIAWGK